jgi:hypothetical protein
MHQEWKVKDSLYRPGQALRALGSSGSKNVLEYSVF